MPERRTHQGVYWYNPDIGITEEHAYSLNSFFVPDGKEQRVQEVWPGKWGEMNKKTGWDVGAVYFEGRGTNTEFRLVLFDNTLAVRGISPKRLKPI